VVSPLLNIQKALMKKTALVLFCLVYVLHGQQTWEATYGPNFNKSFGLLKKDNYIFLASETGMYRSQNGTNWTRLNFPGGFELHYLVGCGDRLFTLGLGKLHHSDDNGSTWTADTLDDILVAQVYNKEIYAASYRKLYHSSDSGQTWQQMSCPIPANERLNGIVIFQGKLYISSSDGEVFRLDPNNSWNVISSLPGTTGAAYSYDDNNLFNDNDQFLYICIGQELLRTTADNQPWQIISPAEPNNFILNYRIIGNEIYLGGVEHSYVSDKNNINWTKLTNQRNGSDFLVDGNSLYLASETLFRSTDNGQTWERLYNGILPNSWHSEFFFNGNRLWCQSQSSPDQGTTWTTPYNDSIFVLYHSDNMVIARQNYYYTEPNRYIISPDNGLNWKPLQLGQIINAFADGNFLFVCTDNHTYRSVDGGNSWQLLHNFDFRFYKKAAGTLFITRDDGVFKSQDHGSSWTSCNNGLPNAEPGWINWTGSKLIFSNINGPAYISADFGYSWNVLPEDGLGVWMRTTWAASADKIFASGYNFGDRGFEVRNGIYELNLGDSTWHILINDSSKNTNHLEVNGPYLFGDIFGYGIMRLKTADEFSGMQELKVQNTSQIYPNPTQGIVYVDKPGAKEIQVTDVSGKIVFVGKLGNPGESIDLSFLPAGIYCYRLSTTLINNKLVIIK
jgi:photosystem II stability/assembly factor-like uncharacterized protein